MRKLVITLGIWLVAALLVAAVHWPAAPSTADALAGSTPTPSTTAATAEHGKALFMAKGCTSCHSHASTGFARFEVGPNLTYYQADPEFLQRWLRNPQSIRPNTEMPNLNLKPNEIDALIAFLSTNQSRP